MSALDGLLSALLDCGSLDISILDDVGYDLGEIAVELQAEGVKITLNNITDAIFHKGQDELKDALENKISELEDERDECEEDSKNMRTCRNRLMNWNAVTRRKMLSGSVTVLTHRFGSEITRRFTESTLRMKFPILRRTWDLNFRRNYDGSKMRKKL